MYSLLGPIPFQLCTSFLTLEGKRSYNYAEHAVIEGKPRLQYVGDGLEEIAFSVRFHTAFCSPLVMCALLLAAAASHVALPLIFANGLYRGRYVILDIADTMETMGVDGSIVSIELKITLREWVPDNLVEMKKAEKKKTAPALKKKKGKSIKSKKVNFLAQASQAGYQTQTFQSWSRLSQTQIGGVLKSGEKVVLETKDIVKVVDNTFISRPPGGYKAVDLKTVTRIGG